MTTDIIHDSASTPETKHMENYPDQFVITNMGNLSLSSTDIPCGSSWPPLEIFLGILWCALVHTGLM